MTENNSSRFFWTLGTSGAICEKPQGGPLAPPSGARVKGGLFPLMPKCAFERLAIIGHISVQSRVRRCHKLVIPI